MDGQTLQMVTSIAIVILVVVVAIIGLMLFISSKQEKKAGKKSPNKDEKGKESDSKYQPGLTRESIYNFMEFDEIKDNMIVRKGRKQYVMVIQCQGVNYDLLSEEEKIAVEEGFVQFLNILRYPIQLYVQTSSLNLRDITDEYKRKVRQVEDELEQIRIRLRDAQLRKNEKAIKDLKFQEKRKKNILEYTSDITDYVGRLSLNKNVLQQKTYVVVSYFSSELGNMSTYSKEEIDNMCFSELYTRCESLIRSLATSSVSGRVLNSEELAELLYVAYNRDDEELIQLSKALDAEYDALYNIGRDVLEKKKQQIEEKMDMQAAKLASESLIEADKELKEKKAEMARTEKVKKRALNIVDQYKDQMSDDLVRGTKKKIIEKTQEEQSKITGEAQEKLTNDQIEKLSKRTIKGKRTV